MKIKKFFCAAVCGMTAVALSAGMLSAFAEDPAETNGYKGALTLTPGQALMDSLGFELKDTDVNFAYENGGSAAAEINYGGQRLTGIEADYDSETNRLYFRIPELSEEVLYIDLNSETPDDEDPEDGGDGEEIVDMPDVDIEDITDGSFIPDIDLDAAFSALSGYLAEIAPLFGEGEVGTESFDLPGDMSVDYTAVTYKLTAEQAVDFTALITDAVKDDEALAALAEYMGYDGENPAGDMIYDFIWANENESDNEYSFTTLYEGTSCRGIVLETETRSEQFVFGIKDGKTSFARDFTFDFEVEKISEGEHGWIAVGEDGSLLGEQFNYTSESESGYYYSEDIVFDNVLVDDTSAKGHVVFTSTDSDIGETKADLTFDMTETNHAFTASLYFGGDHFITVDYSGAADLFEGVELDTEGAYDLLDESQLDEYMANADAEGFKAHAKEVLGEDLYTYLFGEDEDDSSSEIDTPTVSGTDDEDQQKSDSSSDSSSAASSSAAGTTASSAAGSKANDASPNTGAAAAGTAAVLFAAAALAVSKKK